MAISAVGTFVVSEGDSAVEGQNERYCKGFHHGKIPPVRGCLHRETAGEYF